MQHLDDGTLDHSKATALPDLHALARSTQTSSSSSSSDTSSSSADGSSSSSNTESSSSSGGQELNPEEEERLLDVSDINARYAGVRGGG